MLRVFQWREIDAAVQHAANGGQAVHLHRIVFSHSPSCFKAAIKRGEQIAHLFDQDTARLTKTARRLGVRVVYIDKQGLPHQHIDLCGKPLQQLLQEVQNESTFPADDSAD